LPGCRNSNHCGWAPIRRRRNGRRRSTVDRRWDFGGTFGRWLHTRLWPAPLLVGTLGVRPRELRHAIDATLPQPSCTRTRSVPVRWPLGQQPLEIAVVARSLAPASIGVVAGLVRQDRSVITEVDFAVVVAGWFARHPSSLGRALGRDQRLARPRASSSRISVSSLTSSVISSGFGSMPRARRRSMTLFIGTTTR